MTQPKIDHLEAVRPDSIQPIVVDGVTLYAFTVKPGDVQPWDAQNIGPNQKPNERAELSLDVAPSVQKGRGPYTIREGMTQTYDVDFRFKQGFPPHAAGSHEWAMIWQAHPQDDSKGPKGFTGVSVHDGMITLQRPGGADGDYFLAETIVPDKWYHRRIVVRWSAGLDGYVKWVDRLTSKLMGQFDGQTIAKGEWKYLKQGYYRAGGLPEGTVYSTLMDISGGDLSAENPAEPPPEPPGATPVTPPAPQPTQPGIDARKAQAGLQALVDARALLEKVTLPGLDAQIGALQQRRQELQARRDAIAKVLDLGDWGGGVAAK